MSDGRVAAARRFSASEAAFAGFRLLAREPVAGLAWAGVMLAFGLVLGGLMVLAVGPAMTEIMTAGPKTDPAAQLSLLGRVAPIYALVLPLSLLLYAVFYAAVNRAVLRPGERGLAYLRLGADELRQVGVLFLYGVVLFAIYIVVAVVMAVLLVVLGVAASAAGQTPGGAFGPAVLIGLLIGFGFMAVVLFVAVRLSLCTSLTFDKGEVDLFGSWRMTRRRFWPLFGAFFLAWLVCVVLWAIVAVLFGAVAVGAGGLGAATLMFQPHMDSLQAYFSPLQVAWIVLSAGMGAVFLTVLIGVSADAYRQLRDLEQPEAAPARPATGF